MTTPPSGIPLLDITPLFGTDPAALARLDRALLGAAQDPGFLTISGPAEHLTVSATQRRQLLGVFALTEEQRRPLYRRKFAAENRNVYRGWFPVQPGNASAKEGIDIGPDVAHGSGVVRGGDPLREPTPLPAEAQLPGWHFAVRQYYLAMERVAQALMRSLARSLGLSGDYFDSAFRQGLSTLRLIRYPPRAAGELTGAPHTDSGFVTLLAQDGEPGLQVRSRDGRWLDVPPIENTLVVNFGQVLEQWSAGRIRATEHRVLASGRERHSLPFFYEARAEARIAPLPGDLPDRFEPFLYGDFLWQRMTSFVEFRGMELERQGVKSGR